MSVNVNGLVGLASWAPHDIPTREISAAEIRDALARREAGQGWQTIAKVIGVNVIDLRRACGDSSLPPEFRGEDRPVAKSRPLANERGPLASAAASVETSSHGAAAKTEAAARRLQLLAAIAAGHPTPLEAAAHLGIEVTTLIYTDFSTLRRGGLIEGDCRAGNIARLTEAGQAKLRELTSV